MAMMRSRCFIIHVLFVLLCGASKADAAQAGDEAADFVSRIIAEREKLRRGHFSVQFSCDEVTEDDAVINFTGNLRTWFDLDNDYVRTERQGNAPIDLRSSTELTAELLDEMHSGKFTTAPKVVPFVSLYLRNSDYSATWEGIGTASEQLARTNVGLHAPFEKLNTGLLAPLAISGAGLFRGQELGAGLGVKEITLDWASRALSSRVVKMSGGLLALVHVGEEFRRTTEVDPGKDYACLRTVIEQLGEDGVVVPAPRCESIAEWEEINGVWVPVRIQINETNRNGRSRKTIGTISWKSVNDPPFSPSVFELPSIEGVWAGVDVYDRRETPPKYLSTYGSDDIPAHLFAEPGSGQRSVNPGGIDWKVITIANLAVLVAFGFAWWIRKIRRHPL